MPARSRRTARAAAIALLALLGAGLAAAWGVPLPDALHAPPSTVVAWADGSPAHVFLSPDDKVRIAVRLDEVDPDYLRALLALEDARFRRHAGVDPPAVLRAAWSNVRRGRVVSGASTITMQLARLLEPRPRTLRSKALEALRALQLELRLSKDEILEAYLQRLPFGGNVEGIEAASYACFGHGASQLAPDEIAVLLAVPQDPNGRRPGPGAARLRAARDAIAARLLEADALPRGEVPPAAILAQVRAARLPAGMRPFPRAIPHAAHWLRARHPSAPRIRTTLDRGVQRIAERALLAARAELAALGIHNGAVVVAEHRTGAVRALVGNFDFFDAAHAGQVPGFDAPRSPGSALKPFVYALALDGGLAAPEHLVPDVPVDYAGYAPENYDGAFSGLVKLEDALSQSLNVPFVDLLGELGVDRFLGLLRAGGVAGLDPRPGHYGLSAALGAAEVTPLELTGLYAALAAGGRYRALRTVDRTDGPVGPPAVADRSPGTRLFSPGAAWLTRRALARRDRPDFPERRRLTGAPAAVHWKTGTSYGHRDAWAVGSGPRHTAAVWLGNFDNTPAVDLVGAAAAGPVLFDVLEGVAAGARPPAPAPPPADLEPVRVCAYSGRVPTPACPHTGTVLAPVASVPPEPCPFHVRVEVDAATGLAVNPACRAGPTRLETYLVWPARIRRWLGEAHRWLPEPPSLAPGCAPGGPRRGPRILSPAPGHTVLLLPGLPADRQEVPLEADGPPGAGRLSWFVDGRYLGTVPARERVWWTPEAGAHEVVVVDEAGLRDARRVNVR